MKYVQFVLDDDTNIELNKKIKKSGFDSKQSYFEELCKKIVKGEIINKVEIHSHKDKPQGGGLSNKAS